jgi:aminotransferase
MRKDYAHYLSATAKELQPSGIRKFFDLAASMKDVISLGVGEPDFITPWNIREAAILSMEQGYTSYTANPGLLELREEIANYLGTRFAVNYDPKNQIIVTVGAI